MRNVYELEKKAKKANKKKRLNESTKEMNEE